MRGTNRVAFSGLLDKSIRFFFLVLLVWPLTAFLPIWLWFIGVCAYAYVSYLDGAERCGRASDFWQRGIVARVILGYFRADYRAEGGDVKFSADQKYIFGVHPHGVLPVCTMAALMSPDSRLSKALLNGVVRMRALVASFCFFLPLYREMLVGTGIVDASRYNARRVLDEGLSLALVPGGATESLYARPGVHCAYIKRRKGFIKLALETGAHLVPVYSFGENEVYGQMGDIFPLANRARKKFQGVFGIALPLVTNIIPRRVKITTVVGRPIPVERVANPTDEQVEALLDVYIQRLQRLFNEFAPELEPRPESRVLQIL
jgi:hypothetical protein